MEQYELDEILRLHKMWYKGEEGGKIADLSGADLSGADLREVNLFRADLSGADLSGADLFRADLSCAILCKANLHGAKILEANLVSSILREADLSGADLYKADIRNANFNNADLRGVCFYRADLRDTDFRGADLCNAILSYADLRGTDFRWVKNMPHIPLECPSDGSFIGWKKLTTAIDTIGQKNAYLIKLEIPEDAKRSSATTKKCRCSKAKVLGIYNLDGSETNIKELTSTRYTWTAYKVGEMVYPDSFDDNRWNECSNGIHFFINKQDAINY